MTAPSSRRLAAALLLGLGLAVPCALQAWMSDDAFITLRVVDNVLHGRGAVWNLGQRVQVYTHPAWFALLVVATSVTRELFVTPMVLGVLLTFAFAVGLSLRAPLGRALFALALLAASPSFVDYATSGLENPLTHVLLLLAALEATRCARAPTGAQAPPHGLVESGHASGGGRVRFGRLVLFGGLLHLTRPDGVLLMMPLLVLHAAGTLRTHGAGRTLRALVLGGLPVVGWYAFALVYYGTPVANTALAKLGAGLPPRHTWPVGLHYLGTLFASDPSAGVLVLGGAWTALRAWRHRAAQPGGATALAWFLGTLLHTAYVVSIGGDFMLGRFWTPWLAVSALLVALHGTPQAAPAPTRRRAGVVLAMTTVLGVHAAVFVLGAHPAVPEASVSQDRQDERGVSDERAFYAEHLSVQAYLAGRGPHTLPSGVHAQRLRAQARESETRVVVEGPQAGVLGFVSGPDVHVVDPFALTDPLLARLPSFRMPVYRAGHLPRVVPAGYVESERRGEDHFEDPALGALWQRVALLTRGALFTRERWEAIGWFLTHRATEGLEVDRYLLAHATHTTPEALALGPARVRDMGIHVDLGDVQRAAHVTVRLSPPDRRELWFYRGPTRLAELVVPASNDPVAVPEPARAGFDRVVVLPRDHYRPESRTLDGFELDGAAPGAPASPAP